MNVEKSVDQGLDPGAVLGIPVRQFIPWAAAVAFITYIGYPGVICITPMAWLIALQVGLQVSLKSKSTDRFKRQKEAGLAGGVLGLLEGILFVVVVPLMGPIGEDEMGNSIVLVAAMLILGLLVGAGMSAFTAWVNENRLESKGHERMPQG